MLKKLHLKTTSIICGLISFICFGCQKDYNLNYTTSKIDDSEFFLDWDYPVGYYIKEEFITCFKLRIKVREENNKLYLYKDVDNKELLFEINDNTSNTINLITNGKNVHVESNIIESNIYRIRFSNLDISNSSCPFIFNGIVLYYSLENKIIGSYLFLDENETFNQDEKIYIYNPIGKIYENFQKKETKVVFDNKDNYEISPSWR